MAQMQNILNQYGLNAPLDIRNIHNDTWQIGNDYILKKHENTSELNKVLTINKFLKNESIPVTDYIQTDSGKDYVMFNDGAYSLMRKMSGKHIESFYGESTDTAYNLGIEIGRLHKALKKLQNYADIYNSYLSEDLKSIVIEIQANGIDIPDKIIASCLDFEIAYKELARQLIHRDIWVGNILFENGRLTGFLDFDSGEINARLYDIVYFGQSILINNYMDDKYVEWWHEFFGSLLKGYNTENKLLECELKAIQKLCVAMQLVFISYYLWVKEKSHLIPNRVGMAKWAYENDDVFKFEV